MLKKYANQCVLIIFLFISAYLAYKWIDRGALLAHAEEGIPFYDPIRTFRLYRDTWVEVGFGIATPFYIPRLVLYGISALFSLVGIPGYLIQSLLFVFLFCSGMYWAYYLSKSIFPSEGIRMSFMVGLFYLFNLFSMSQIWGRFIYPLMFLWAYLPLWILLWIKWNETTKIKYLALLLISSIIYSDAFGLTSSIIVIWIPAFLYTIVTFFSTKTKKKLLLNSIIGLIAWGIANIWWLAPTYFLKDNAYSTALVAQKNIDSLIEVSNFFPISEILTLKQAFLFGPANTWASPYSSGILLTIPKTILLITMIGIILSFKSKRWGYLITLSLVSFFIVKGANGLLGKELYTFLFDNFSITQILRNPYEKVGSLWLLSYALFFGYGLNLLLKKFSRLSVVLFMFSVYYFIYLLPTPMWTGSVIPSEARITIPSYYSEANSYLNEYDSRRLLQLPLLRESSTRFTWGYVGEEPSEFLFDRTSLSRSLIFKEIDGLYPYFPIYLKSANFTKLLVVSDISSIVVHEDTVLNPFNQESPQESSIMVSKWNDIQTGEKFGALRTYHVDKKILNTKLYVVSNIKLVGSDNEVVEGMLEDGFDPNNDALVKGPEADTILEGKSTYNVPSYKVEKLSDKRYKIHVTEAKEPFILVFSENFNSKWKAFLGGEEIDYHFKVNSYANAWKIVKQGNFEIEVIYKLFQ